MKEQSESQKRSKSPLNGYRKPHYDDIGNKWCSCTIPVLISGAPISEQPLCLRCFCNYYH
jgi:hypothetical protein